MFVRILTAGGAVEVPCFVGDDGVPTVKATDVLATLRGGVRDAVTTAAANAAGRVTSAAIDRAGTWAGELAEAAIARVRGGQS